MERTGKGLTVGLLAVAIGLGLAGFGYSRARVAGESRDWPTARGRILTSSMRKDRHAADRDRERYRVDVDYTYEVDGTNYDGSTVGAADSTYVTYSRAHRITDLYPMGEEVDVYYDPADPARAVLEPGGGWRSWLMVLGGGVVALAGAAVAVGLIPARLIAFRFGTRTR